MSRTITPGSLNESTEVRIIDSTAGTPEESVTKDTAGLALWYRREGEVKAAITPITDLSALTDAWSSGGMLHIDDGYYRVDVPDAAFASGAGYVTIGGAVTDMIMIAAHHTIGSAADSSGARTVTVTVNDGATALESASVRFTKGAATYVQSTDASGNCTFNLDDGTWTVAISLVGYTYSGTTQVVDGDETPTYSMTAISISAPSAPALCTVNFQVNVSATAVAGATCKASLIGHNQASDGTVLSTQELSATTDALGAAELELVRKDAIVKGSGVYQISVEVNGEVIASKKTTIPNQATCYFEDLM